MESNMHALLKARDHILERMKGANVTPSGMAALADTLVRIVAQIEIIEAAEKEALR